MSKRLTHHEYYNLCCILDAERELVKTMTTGAIINLLEAEGNVKINSRQLADMLESVGIDRKDIDSEVAYVVRAIAERMKWPWGVLVTEGKVLLKDREKEATAQAAASPPLPMEIGDR